MWLWKVKYDLSLLKKVLSKNMPSSFEEGKLIFVHIPKTAGLSLALTLFGEEVGHFPVWVYRAILGDEYNDYFSFSFVRHPVDRLISAYYFLKQGGMKEHKTDRMFKEKVVDKYSTFESFVLEYLNEKTIYSYIHLFPQSYFLTYKGEIIVSFLGRVENMKESIKALEERLNRKIDLPVLNKSNRPRGSLSIGEDVFQKIRHLYKKDFTLLGYT